MSYVRLNTDNRKQIYIKITQMLNTLLPDFRGLNLNMIKSN